MLRKLISAIVLLPIAAALIALAMANRHPVPVSFDLFGSADPELALHAPLFVLGFAVLITGVLLGGAAAWLAQRKWRRAARRLRDENRKLLAERDALQRQSGPVADTRFRIAQRPPAA